MADIYETQVKLSFKVPVGEVERVKKILEAAISPSIMKRIQGIPAMVGMGAPGAGVGGIVGGLAGLAGPLGFLVIAANQGVDLLKRAVGFLAKSSPALRGVLHILNKAFLLFFRPFGDYLATTLRPLSRSLLKASRAWLKWTRELGKAIEETPGGTEFVELLKTYFTTGNLGTFLGEQLAKLNIWDWIVTEGKPIWEWITDATRNIFYWITEKSRNIFYWITEASRNIFYWITETSRPIFHWITDVVKPVWDWISTPIKDVWDWITTPIKDVWDWISTPIKSIWDFISPIIGFPQWFQKGGVVPGPLGAPIPAILHGGETVIPTTGGVAGITNISLGGVRINVDKITSDYDVNRLADKIGDLVIDRLRARI